MANMTFKANLLPNSNLGYNLGSSEQQWNIYGTLKGNADSATKLSNTPNDTSKFLRGDNTWTNSLKGIIYITDTINNAILSLQSGAGTMNVYSHGTDIGNDRGIWLAAHGTDTTGKNVFTADINNNVTFNGYLNGSADKVDNLHGRDLLRVYYTNSDLSSTELINTDHYLYSVGDTGGWGAITTKPSGIDNAFGILHCHLHSNNYAFQLGFGGTNDTLYYRSAYNESIFKAWRTVLSSSNYTSYTVTKTGGGASGTWGINISGNAATSSSCSGNAASSTISSKLSVTDNRSVNETPSTLMGEGRNLHCNFKYRSTINSPAGSGTYGFLLNLIPWGDSSGSYPKQIWVDDNTISTRYGTSATGWSSWKRVWVEGNAVTGAVWNDYAEYRITNTIEFGRCVYEVGDDSMSLSTKRLQKGCAITSDTWGFAQGKTEQAQTPIAVAGRVLAYPYEDRNEFRKHIGDCVCSGPNGTVSIMTEEEEIKYPSRIIGIISAVPDYEEWGGGEGADREPVKVNGRVWIRIR